MRGLFFVLGGDLIWIVIANTPPSLRQPQKASEVGGIEIPEFHTERVVATAETVLPHPSPQVTECLQLQFQLCSQRRSWLRSASILRLQRLHLRQKRNLRATILQPYQHRMPRGTDGRNFVPKRDLTR